MVYLAGLRISARLTRQSAKPTTGTSAIRKLSSTKGAAGPLVWYSRKLDSHPILTKSISSGIVGGSGDILSQYIEARREGRPFHWDVVRTSRFGFLSLALVGPVMHHWFGALTRWFPGQSATVVAKRVLVDQLVCAPLFVTTFLSGLWVLEGNDVDKLLPTLQHQVPPTIVANWALWIPAQVINFRFVASKYQVLFSNGVGFVWNCYLSFTTHNDSNHQAEEEK